MKYILTVALFILTSFPAFAQNDVSDKIIHSDASVNDAEQLYADLKDIVGTLEEQNQRHFLGIYSTYTTIGAVKAVRTSVENTVKACGKENPDLKDKMDSRYATWVKAIDPVLKEADTQVKNMIIAQDYEQPKTIRAFLKRTDDVRTKTAESITKIPVTTPEGCNYLHDKMDETQITLTDLLQETLIAIPRSINTAKQAEAAEEKEEKEKTDSQTETEAEKTSDSEIAKEPPKIEDEKEINKSDKSEKNDKNTDKKSEEKPE
jgi:hypothetical protein